MTDDSAPQCRKTKRASITTPDKRVAPLGARAHSALGDVRDAGTHLKHAPFSGGVFSPVPRFGARSRGAVAYAQKKQ
jgi:hypothetical protein